MKREGRAHSLWINPATGVLEAVPRHTEIPDMLAEKSAADCPHPRLVDELTEPCRTVKQITLDDLVGLCSEAGISVKLKLT